MVAINNGEGNSYGTKEPYRSLINGKAKISENYNLCYIERVKLWAKKVIAQYKVYKAITVSKTYPQIFGTIKGVGALIELWENNPDWGTGDEWIVSKLKQSDILNKVKELNIDSEKISHDDLWEFKVKDASGLKQTSSIHYKAIANAIKDSEGYLIQDCKGFERIRFKDGFEYNPPYKTRVTLTYNLPTERKEVIKVQLPLITAIGCKKYLASKNLPVESIKEDKDIQIKENNSRSFYQKIGITHKNYEQIIRELNLLGYTLESQIKEKKAQKYASKVGEKRKAFYPTLPYELIDYYLSREGVDKAEYNDITPDNGNRQTAQKNSRIFWAIAEKFKLDCYLVEGEFKAMTLISHGILAIAFVGVTSFYTSITSNEKVTYRNLNDEFLGKDRQSGLFTWVKGIIWDYDAAPSSEYSVMNAMATTADLINQALPNNKIIFVRCLGIKKADCDRYYKKTGKHYKQGIDDYLNQYRTFLERIEALSKLTGENTYNLINRFYNKQDTLSTEVKKQKAKQRTPQRKKHLWQWLKTASKITKGITETITINTDRISDSKAVVETFKKTGVAIALKSATGTGKSYFVTEAFIKDQALQGKSVLIYAPLNSICDDSVKNLKTLQDENGLPLAATKNDLKSFYGKDFNTLFHLTKVVAMHPITAPVYIKEDKVYDLIVIEEMHKHIKDFAPGNKGLYNNENDRKKIEDRFIKSIVNCISNGGQLIINDADITQTDIDWILVRIPKLNIILINNTCYKQIYDVEVVNNKNVATDKLISDLLAGKKVVCYTNCQATGESLHNELETANLDSLAAQIDNSQQTNPEIETLIDQHKSLVVKISYRIKQLNKSGLSQKQIDKYNSEIETLTIESKEIATKLHAINPPKDTVEIIEEKRQQLRENRALKKIGILKQLPADFNRQLVIKRIDAHTKDETNPQFDPWCKAFLEGDKQTRDKLLADSKVDILTYSPSMGTSYSIEGDYFDVVYGFCNNQASYQDIIQGINRYRKNVKRVVWIEPNMSFDLFDNANFFGAEYHKRKIKGQQIELDYETQLAENNAKLLDIEKSALGAICASSTETIKKITDSQKALVHAQSRGLENIAKVCCVDLFIDHCQQIGCTVTINNAIWQEYKAESSTAGLVQVNPQQESEVIEARINYAFTLSVDDLKTGRNQYSTTETITENLEAKQKRSYKETMLLYKLTLLNQFPGIELNKPLAYMLSHSPKFLSKVVAQYIWDNKHENDLALIQTVNRQKKESNPLYYSLDPVKFSKLRLTGIKDFIAKYSQESFTLDNDDLLNLCQILLDNRAEFNALFGLRILDGSRSLPKNARVHTLNKMIEWLGYKVIEVFPEVDQTTTKGTESGLAVIYYDDQNITPAEYRIINTLEQSNKGTKWKTLVCTNRSPIVQVRGNYQIITLDNVRNTLPAKFSKLTDTLTLPTENNPSPAIDSFLESIPEDEIQDEIPDEFISFDCTDSLDYYDDILTRENLIDSKPSEEIKPLDLMPEMNTTLPLDGQVWYWAQNQGITPIAKSQDNNTWYLRFTNKHGHEFIKPLNYSLLDQSF